MYIYVCTMVYTDLHFKVKPILVPGSVQTVQSDCSIHGEYIFLHTSYGSEQVNCPLIS